MIDKAQTTLLSLKDRYSLIVVTSRRAVLRAETDAWLEKFFPGIFTEVHYAGIWDGTDNLKHALRKNKAALCRELGAQYLIDDQLKHCIGAAECGIEALLFGNYRWNRRDKLPKNITEVHTWNEVAEYFDGKS